MPMYEYRCAACGRGMERFVPLRMRKFPVRCECGALAHYTVSAPRIDPRLGIRADQFPSMGDRWARLRLDQLAKEEKHNA